MISGLVFDVRRGELRIILCFVAAMRQFQDLLSCITSRVKGIGQRYHHKACFDFIKQKVESHVINLSVSCRELMFLSSYLMQLADNRNYKILLCVQLYLGILLS